MYEESRESVVAECADDNSSSSVPGHNPNISETFSTQNYGFGSFRSPVIPQIQPQSVGPYYVYQYGSAYSTFNQFRAVQERIDKSLWLCDYADDIFQTLRETELKRRLICFRSQQVVEIRPKLLSLLKEATEKNKLARTTLHLAVYLLDCFMDNYTIRYDKLNLTAITCLIIAAKIEETDSDMPKFCDLNKLCDKPYRLEEFKNVECKVLATFNFDLLRPTAATFAEYFANSFITLQDFHIYVNHWNNEMAYNQYQFTPEQQHQQQEQESTCDAQQNASECAPQSTLHQIANTPCPYSSYEDMLSTLNKTFFTLIDVTLNYLRFANARPSIIASACIAAVRQMHGIFPVWSPYLVKLTDCTADIIAPFVEAILAIYRLYCNTKLLQQNETPNTPTAASDSISWSILCDSPDSGIVLHNDTKSTISDDEAENLQPVNIDLIKNHDSESEEEDEPYNCLEYPLLPKRRRIF